MNCNKKGRYIIMADFDIKNYETVNPIDDAEDEDWSLTGCFRSSIKQATVLLCNGKENKFASRWPFEEGDLAIIGNTLIRDEKEIEQNEYSGLFGEIIYSEPKLSLKKSTATELDYVFTKQNTKKAVKECVKYLDKPVDNKTVEYGNFPMNYFPLSFVIRRLLAAASVIAHHDYASEEEINRAKDSIGKAQDLNEMDIRHVWMRAPGFDFTDVQVNTKSYIKNLKELGMKPCYLFDDNDYDTLPFDYHKANIYLNKYSHIGAVSVMVRGRFINLLIAYLSAEPPIQDFFNEMVGYLKTVASPKAIKVLEDYRTLSHEEFVDLYKPGETQKHDKSSNASGKNVKNNGKESSNDKSKAKLDPEKNKEVESIEEFCRTKFNIKEIEAFIRKQKINKKPFEAVKYKNTDVIAPDFVSECAVVPYMQMLTKLPTQIGSYEKDYIKFSLNSDSDKAEGMLDEDSFGELLNTLMGPDMPTTYHIIVPFGRYASGKQITNLVSRMNKWKKWDEYSATGRKSIIIARGAILLNDSREAMLYADKEGAIDYYAGLRNMDADVMRDQIMSDFGLDKDGKKVFDLGNTTIEVSVDKELKLSLYDTANDKAVKSIPKRGADPDKYDKAKSDFADIKKNLKEIVKNRTELLFDHFLSGRTREPESWKKSYLNNYILHKVGELVVWDQKGKSFILTETGVINCFGDYYEINDKEPIGVAHPVKMNAVEIQCWQRYFTSHGLKQPFEQVWEPVIDMDKFKPDRYKGRMIPYYKFLKKEKEGIYVYDRDFHNEIEIRLIGCKADIYRVDFERHQIDMNHRFEVEKITVSKPSRISNHILAYLDRITMVDRVIADDVTLLQTLHDLSYAQIMDYIKIANENNAVNVLAGLMDYKESNYSDFNPMDEFVLE